MSVSAFSMSVLWLSVLFFYFSPSATLLITLVPPIDTDYKMKAGSFNVIYSLHSPGSNLALSRHLVSALPAKFPMSVSQAFGYSPFDQLFSKDFGDVVVISYIGNIRAKMEKFLNGVRARFTQAKACGYQNCCPDEVIVLYFG